MSQPNDISLYINLFEINLTKAKKIYNEEYDSRKKFIYNQLLSEDETKQFYDYFEYIISAVVFSYTALEAFVNICIIDGYEYIRNDKNGNPEKLLKKKY